MLKKTLESPLDCKKIQPVHSEGDQYWDFFGRNDAKAETPVLWPPHAKSWLIGQDSAAGRDWGQEDIKKRWQEYTEELYKKDLHDPDNHKGVITHLEPDILECEVKWALGSITTKKLVKVMEFQLSYFKS